MSDMKERIQGMVDNLREDRDELRVQMRLAKMEASDEWREIETKLAKLEAKTKELGGATAQASKEIGAAAKLLGQEIRDGFKSIAKHF